jgi:hypothetical protein
MGNDRKSADSHIDVLITMESDPSHWISEARAMRMQAKTVARQTPNAYRLASGVKTRGLITNIKGTKNATIEKRMEITAILRGFAPEIAEAA